MKEAVIHVYGFQRPVEKRRAMVSKVTAAACEAYQLSPEQVTVYFFDLNKDSSGYAGLLVSDSEAAQRSAIGHPPSS